MIVRRLASSRVRWFALLLGCSLAFGAWVSASGQEEPQNGNSYPAGLQHRPSPIPDRVILTWSSDPATTVDVTWRTDSSAEGGIAEFTRSTYDGDHLTGRIDGSQRVVATTTPFQSDLGPCHYHSAKLQGLKPATKYLYRVGDGVSWSEWFQFKTASDGSEPFTFIYFGDAQNSIRSLWSRVVREAHADAPRAAFMLHAGDLVNHPNSDGEWGEWFGAGGWLNGMIPSIPTPGNHEYDGQRLSRHWRPQFALPTNGPPGLEESTYWLDYQGVRLISLNSNEQIERQTAWLERVLEDNLAQWTIATFHHPIFSTAKGRDNPTLRAAWKPVFDKYGVDLVLQGHDHTYSRTGFDVPQNVATGANVQRGRTVYVVSVSGPKMYEVDEQPYFRRAASGAQLYQLIHINGDTLDYEARLATGQLYDAFTLQRRGERSNELIDRIPDTPEIRKQARSAVGR